MLSSSQREIKSGKLKSCFEEFKRKYSLRYDHELGSGTFGRVFEGIREEDNLLVAIKYIKRANVIYWQEVDGHALPIEIVLLTRCQHIPGVIKMYEYFEVTSGFLIVMERLNYSKDLFDYVTENVFLNEDETRSLFYQLIQTLLSCHNVGVLHRDIKDENILIDISTLQIRLIDFRSGAFLKDTEYNEFHGTTEYSPPKWIRQKRYFGRTAEVWSLGILLYDMFCGNLPFETNDQICDCHLDFQWEISTKCKDLIRRCLQFDPHARPSLDEILKHPWMQHQGHRDTPLNNALHCSANSMLEESDPSSNSIDKPRRSNSEPCRR